MAWLSASRLIALPLAASALISGCDRSPAPKVVEAPVSAPAASVPSPPFSINEMMVMIVDQPGELLWDVEKQGKAPKNSEGWYQLENHAVSLAAAATLIQLGGTGPADAGWVQDPKWKATSQQLVTAALAARQAAKAKNLAELIKANGQIVDACEACHKIFKPDLPTGGLFIHERPTDARGA